jgi:hypothetical protein
MLTLDEFRSDFSEFAPQVRGLIRTVDQLSPPLQAEPVHQKLINSLGNCSQAVDIMEDWFHTPASGTENAVTLPVTEGVEEVTAAQQDLIALISKD